MRPLSATQSGNLCAAELCVNCIVSIVQCSRNRGQTDANRCAPSRQAKHVRSPLDCKENTLNM